MVSADDPQLEKSKMERNWSSDLPHTSHVQLFRSTDWVSTDLGPLDDWGPSLRFASAMVFSDSRGACVYWGPQRIAFYNESFMPMAGSAHPLLMGKPFSVGFPELEAGIRPIFEKAEADGMAVDVNNIPLFTERNGYLEETFFIGQFIPLRGDSGKVEGFYNTVFESTFRVLHDRRRRVLDRLTALPTSSVLSTFQHVLEVLQTGGHDIPMMLLYCADGTTVPGVCQLTLEGSIGLSADHRSAPAQADLHQSKETLIALFRKAQAGGEPLVLEAADEVFQISGTSLLDDIEWAGFGEPSKEIIIAPLANATRLFGFLVLGTNPRREYDVGYQQFFGDIFQQLLAKLNSAVSMEEARRREESLLRELADSERRIRYMAMYAPIGFVHVDLTGTVIWANEQYYDILGLSKEAAASSMSWYESYVKEDVPAAEALWTQLLEGRPGSCEVRLKRLYTPPSGPPGHACALVSGFPLKENGKVRYLMGCFTDVSRLKWAESVQSLNAAAAREAKRQQEDFIDVTSHELRNPLGVVMQCAENIANSLQGAEPTEVPDALRSLRENVEIAETILACATHQKRIIDDVLLLSRLESSMLSITPVHMNVDTIVSNAERMFRGECAQNNISFTVEKHVSLADHHIDSVMCDPSRLMQIIINIVSNGIKYVRTEAKRKISIMYGAGKTASEVYESNPEVRWCPSLKKCEDLTVSPEWGSGQPLYIFFAVRDSGPGLKPQEIDRLFQRFVQSTSLTHINYGGSGLGLYISRELAEKQGGEIGVASRVGEGATFSFYIKTRRAERATKQAIDLDHRPRSLSERARDKEARSLPKGIEDRKTSGRTLHVLLTEDNIINQKFLAKGLQKHGFIVHVANHGLEALEILQRSTCWKGQEQGVRIDTILMDWEMPVLDGLATSKRIRVLESEGAITRHIPIIAITANARDEQIQKALDAGMNDVLPKPFLVSSAVAKIHEWTLGMERRSPSLDEGNSVACDLSTPA